MHLVLSQQYLADSLQNPAGVDSSQEAWQIYPAQACQTTEKDD